MASRSGQRPTSRRQAVIRVGPDSATLRGRLLGTRLREQRDAAGLTLVEVSRRLRRGVSTINRWENGEQIPRPDNLHYLLGEIYGVPARVRDELMQLAEDAHEASEAGGVAMLTVDLNWLHRRAIKLETFQDSVVPDPLQTEGYVRAVLRAVVPSFSREQIERLTHWRIERQQRLVGERPLAVAVVVGEAALRSSFGGAEVRRAQLLHLLERAALPNVDLRVLPLGAESHPGLGGPFTILRFDGAVDRDLAMVNCRGGDIFFEDLTRFEQVFRRLRPAALSPRDSRDMIAGMAKEAKGT